MKIKQIVLIFLMGTSTIPSLNAQIHEVQALIVSGVIQGFGTAISVVLGQAFKHYVVSPKPKLIRQTLSPDQIKTTQADLLYTGKTDQQIAHTIKVTKAIVDANKQTGYLYQFNPFRNSSKERTRFENTLLLGPPGAGKTSVVYVIAKNSDMDLFVTTGGDFAKLKDENLGLIDTLFKRLKSNSRPCILFIDEMEGLFGTRDGKSEVASARLTKLLAEFSEPSSKIMLIGATNRPEDLDEAMSRRMPNQIEVTYPDETGRIKLFRLYKQQLFDRDLAYDEKQQTEINALFSDEKIRQMVQTAGKTSPAEIVNIMLAVKNSSLAYNKGIPTNEIIDSVLRVKKEQLEMRSRGFKHTDTETIQQTQQRIAAQQ